MFPVREKDLGANLAPAAAPADPANPDPLNDDPPNDCLGADKN